MSTGLLGSNATVAGVNAVVYTVPTGKVSVITLNICNGTAATTPVSVALSTSTTPTVGEFIEKDVYVIPGGVLERTGIVLGAAERIIVNAGAANVAVVAYGYEENA